MAANEEEVAVYMLYDFGDPDSYEVQSNMRKLGIDDINLYYQLMAREAKISISAYAGGGTALSRQSPLITDIQTTGAPLQNQTAAVMSADQRLRVWA